MVQKELHHRHHSLKPLAIISQVIIVVVEEDSRMGLRPRIEAGLSKRSVSQQLIIRQFFEGLLLGKSSLERPV